MLDDEKYVKIVLRIINIKMMEKILEKVKKVARSAGKEVMKKYKSPIEVIKKKDKTMVTEADFLSEKIIFQGLSSFGYGFLSEESLGSKNRAKEKRVWVIDPIDGTMDFIKKTGEFSIMIGLVEDGQSILGVVYQPVEDNMYYAISGGGAFLEKKKKIKKLEVSKNSDSTQATMLGSRHHIKPFDVTLGEELGISDFLTHGSAGLKICLLADQKADIYINSSDKTAEWDICAADIILKEAGGKISDLSGNPINYNKKQYLNLNGYVASNEVLHKKIIQKIKKIKNNKA